MATKKFRCEDELISLDVGQAETKTTVWEIRATMFHGRRVTLYYTGGEAKHLSGYK